MLVVVTLAFVAAPASAHQVPDGCAANGLGLSFSAFRADGTTPITGSDTVEPGETIKFRTTLSLLPEPNCSFGGGPDGEITITTPDGTVHTVVAPGDVPHVAESDPSFSSPLQSYVVSETDVVDGELFASTTYQNGISHTGGTSDFGALDHDSAGGSASRNVDYQDIALEVDKTADPAVSGECFWRISKSATPDVVDAGVDGVGTATYTVKVTKTGCVEENHRVTGTISVHNPGDHGDAEITGVSDVVSPDIEATVDCGVSFPFDLGPGDTLECTYKADLPDDQTRTNTATVTASGDIDGGSATAEVDFTGVEPSETINEEVTVEDTNPEFADQNGGDPVVVGKTTTFTYTVTFRCGDGEGEFEDGDVHDNTAKIVETGQKDSASVVVRCPQPTTISSCTAYALGLDISPQAIPPLGYDQVLARSTADAMPLFGAGHGDAQEAGAQIVLPEGFGTVATSELGSTCDARVDNGATQADGTAYLHAMDADLDLPGPSDDPTPGLQVELSVDVLREEGRSADNVGSNHANVVTVSGVVEGDAFTYEIGPAPANYEVPIEAGGVEIGFLVLNEQFTAPGTCGTQFSGNALRLGIYDLSLETPLTVPPETLLELTIGHVTTMTCPDAGPVDPVNGFLATCDGFGLGIDVSPVDFAPTAVTSVFSQATTGIKSPFGQSNGTARQVGIDAVPPVPIPDSALSVDVVESGCFSSNLQGVNASNGTATVKDLDLFLDVPVSESVDATPGIQVSLTSSLLHAETGVADGAADHGAYLLDLEVVVEGIVVPVDVTPAPNTMIHLAAGGVDVGTLILNEQVGAAGPCGDFVTNAVRLLVNDPVGQASHVVEVTIAHAAASACGDGGGAGGAGGAGAAEAPLDPAAAGPALPAVGDRVSAEAPSEDPALARDDAPVVRRAPEALDPLAALVEGLAVLFGLA